MTSNKDPLNIAEDDNLRSACIRKLVQKPVSFKKRSITNVIPKIIVQFWHDLNHIPLDVQLCIDSWKSLVSQDFNWVIFDDHTARNFINKRFGTKYVTAFDLCHHPAMRCDFFRICYMLEVGGFYVDADEVIKELIANLS